METVQLPDLRRARTHNTIGLMLLEVGDARTAIRHFETSIALNATAVEPYGNIVLAMHQVGDAPAAVEWSFTALAVAPNEPAVLHNTGVSLDMLGRNEEALLYWKRANELNPNGIETLCSLARYCGSAGDTEGAVGYLEKAETIARHAFESNPQHLDNRAQYNSIRLQLAIVQLPMLYQSTQEILNMREKFEASLEELSSQSDFVLPKALSTTIGSGSMGYYAIYQGFNDVEVRAKLSEIYLKAAPFLAFTAPHVARDRHKCYRFRPAISAAEEQTHENQPNVVVLKRRVRVGFHSAFMRHHSVGLLTQGVIMGLSPQHFEVVVILYEHQVQDEVTSRVLAAVENAIFLDGSDIQRAQQQVAALELDILVFTEIGMDISTYFLAFSRLALRTVVFWGHATTSGMTSPDYFVSSQLFQNPRDDSDDQGRYSECVYRMKHLTTYFTPPVLPSELALLRNADAARKLLGLPSAQSMSVMFLIPQTLYKLHPDFDELLWRILDRVPKSFLVVTTGNTPVLVEQIKQRWRRVLPPHVYRRVYFVRRLETTEFLELAAAAHVVLDPFPVGGGRSSFEVFAVGTPIVAHVPRTSILQLTLGMYRAMGMEDEAGIAFSDDEYVEKAVALATNHTTRQNLRRRILANSHRLYEDHAVIDEWEGFLAAIIAAQPPEIATTGRARTNECYSSA
ncbi:hypothetical protein BBJ28_00019909 [Nothophytophthora sp. Chile5]|nr:hypothetical protein BBJ28_00019909 [Nothophytophthora sp. Chile5]